MKKPGSLVDIRRKIREENALGDTIRGMLEAQAMALLTQGVGPQATKRLRRLLAQPVHGRRCSRKIGPGKTCGRAVRTEGQYWCRRCRNYRHLESREETIKRLTELTRTYGRRAAGAAAGLTKIPKPPVTEPEPPPEPVSPWAATGKTLEELAAMPRWVLERELAKLPYLDRERTVKALPGRDLPYVPARRRSTLHDRHW